MRAGSFDDSYGERADRMDWDALFAACPILFRCFGEHMGRHFRHVLVCAPLALGRRQHLHHAAAAQAGDLVHAQPPQPRRHLLGVVRRAIEYRASHEQAQRPLLVYPLAQIDLDGAAPGPPPAVAAWRPGPGEARRLPGRPSSN